MKLRSCIRLMLLVALPGWGEVEKRVWFILDNSISMNTNDPRGLAKLSAHMFYGLLQPNSGMDSFRLRTLDGKVVTPGSASVLLDYLRNHVTNSAPHTYYLPVIREAVDGLASEQLVSRDHTLRKTIVFVSDGVPEDKDADVLAAQSLAATLSRQDIHLYVLLFGREAKAAVPKVSRMFPPSAQIEIQDDDGSRLLWMVAGFFGRAFGALVDRPRTGPTSIDLKHTLVSSAAVIVFRSRPDLPTFQLSLPTGGRAVGPTQVGSETGSSYALRWLKGVEHGTYGMQTDSDASTLVLRVAPYHIEAFDPRTRKTPRQSRAPRPVLAAEPAEFWFLAPGDPDNVTVSVRVRATGTKAVQLGESVCQTQASHIGEGLLFHVECRFPNLGPEAYPAVMEVMPAQNGFDDKTSGNRIEVQVYPYVKVTLDPPRDSVATTRGARRLRRGEQGCIRFRFRPDTGEALGSKPEIRLRAFLDDTVRGQPAYLQDSTTLDGDPLELDGGQRNWGRGKSIARSSFFEAEHEFCMVAALAPRGTAVTSVTLPVHFFLSDYPYSEMRIINDFQADAEVLPPTWWQLWGNASWLSLGTLACLGLIVGLMRTNYLPPNMACRSWVTPGGAESYTPLTCSGLVRLLRDRRSLLLDNGSYTAGSIRTTDPELFDFVPGPGVNVVPRPGSDGRSGRHQLRVHENYELTCPQGNYVIRIEYT